MTYDEHKLIVENEELRSLVNSCQEEIRTLKKENNDLKRIYKNTYEKLFEKGNEELAHYFMAQIDDCPTFYVEPIIDYYKEYYKQENDIKILLKENEAKEKVIIKQDNVLNDLKWKPIEEYDRKKYDWVLVKFYLKDGYECIPCVAEMRYDGFWYDKDDNIIDYDIKYFFDMQLIDKLKELKESDK